MSYNRKYTYTTKAGKSCRLTEKQVGLLLSRLHSAILTGKVEITTFPEYPDSNAPLMTILMRGRDEDGKPAVFRYYADCDDNGNFILSTPVRLPDSLFLYHIGNTDTVNPFSAFAVMIAKAKTGVPLKSFSIQRGV